MRLQDRELGEAVFALQLEGDDEPLRRVIGGADVPHGARLYERVERAQ